jgi:DNA adenine methylase
MDLRTKDVPSRASLPREGMPAVWSSDAQGDECPAEMTIRAVSPWFGSKRNLAPEIIREVGVHGVYWEPFCGSLAVLLAKDAVGVETASDLHGDLVNLARVIRDDELSLLLYGRLTRFLLHEDLFTEAADRHRSRGHVPAADDPDLDRAADFMVCSWFGRNGVAGTSSYNQGFCVRYTANGGHAATRWQSAVASIPAWHWRLRNVTLLNRDGFDLIERIDDQRGTAIYCDPPYLTKGADYVYDFAADDHARLATLLGRFKRARVVVSYYDHPALDSLYAGWGKRQIEVTKSLVNQGMRDKEGAVKAVEVLLTNGKSFAVQAPGLFG